MIRRSIEQARLEQLLTEAHHEHHPRLGLVIAENGMGKSPLRADFHASLQHHALRPAILLGRGEPQPSRQPYGLIRDLFCDFLNIDPIAPPALMRRTFEQGIVRVLGPSGALKAHLLGHLLGFPFAESNHVRALRGDHRQLRERAFAYATQFFAALAELGTSGGGARPVVWLLEGLQWADDGSLELIEHLLDTLSGTALLIIGFAQPQFLQRRPGWEAQAAEVISLGPLSDAESRTQVAALLGPEALAPQGLGEMLIAQSGGNPLYLEELVRLWREDGVLVAEANGSWRVETAKMSRLRLPATLAETIAARLGNLDAATLGVLQRAAVVGPLFWDAAIPRDDGSPAEALSAHLTTLETRQFIARRHTTSFPGTHEFVFEQELVWHSSYAGVPTEMRARLHGEVAAWLIARAGERVNDYAALIADHLERSGAAPEAGRWYLQAARQAEANSLLEGAAGFYAKALALLPQALEHAATRIEVSQKLGEMLASQARYTEAVAAFEGMLATAEACQDMLAQARAWNAISMTAYNQGDNLAVLANSVRAEACGRQAPGEEGLVEVGFSLVYRAMARFYLGALGPALALGQEALRLGEAVNHPQLLVRSYDVLAWAYNALGQYEQADLHMHQALRILRESGNRKRLSRLLNNLGLIAQMRGIYSEALNFYTESLDIATELNDVATAMALRGNIGGLLASMGQFVEAETILREALTVPETESWFGRGDVYAALARALLGQDRRREAVEAARVSLSFAESSGEREQMGISWRVLGTVVGRWTESDGEPPPEQPLYCFAESLRLFDESGNENERARTLRAWAIYELARGDQLQGDALWREAREIFGKLGLQAEVERGTPFPD